MDVRKDLLMWQEFLHYADVTMYCRPFMDFLDWTVEDIQMYSDASKSEVLGFGAYCQNDWIKEIWPEGWIAENDPSIEFLELFVLTAGVLTWIRRFRNRRIWLFCDNESVVFMVNKMSLRCGKCMNLLRLIALEAMRQNAKINIKHIRSKDNILSDALSRDQMDRFWKHALATMSKMQTAVPRELWPIKKVWT